MRCRPLQMSLFTLAVLVASSAGVFALTIELPAKEFPLDEKFGYIGRSLTSQELIVRLIAFGLFFGFELIGINICRRLSRTESRPRKSFPVPSANHESDLWP